MQSGLHSQLIQRERDYWEALKAADGKRLAAMTDEACMSIGAQGIDHLQPSQLPEVMQSAPWRLLDYALDDYAVEFTRPSESVAVLAYPVREQITVGADHTTIDVRASTVWVRRGSDWLCALHTETPAGDPFGRVKR